MAKRPGSKRQNRARARAVRRQAAAAGTSYTTALRRDDVERDGAVWVRLAMPDSVMARYAHLAGFNTATAQSTARLAAQLAGLSSMNAAAAQMGQQLAAQIEALNPMRVAAARLGEQIAAVTAGIRPAMNIRTTMRLDPPPDIRLRLAELNLGANRWESFTDD